MCQSKNTSFDEINKRSITEGKTRSKKKKKKIKKKHPKLSSYSLTMQARPFIYFFFYYFFFILHACPIEADNAAERQ